MMAKKTLSRLNSTETKPDHYQFQDDGGRWLAISRDCWVIVSYDAYSSTAL